MELKIFKYDPETTLDQVNQAIAISWKCELLQEYSHMIGTLKGLNVLQISDLAY